MHLLLFLNIHTVHFILKYHFIVNFKVRKIPSLYQIYHLNFCLLYYFYFLSFIILEQDVSM